MVSDVGARHFLGEYALTGQLGYEALHDVSGTWDGAGIGAIVAGNFDLRRAHGLYLDKMYFFSIIYHTDRLLSEFQYIQQQCFNRIE